MFISINKSLQIVLKMHSVCLIFTFLKLSPPTITALLLCSYTFQWSHLRLDILLFSTSVSVSFRWITTGKLLAELSNSELGSGWEVWVSKWTSHHDRRRKMPFSVLASRSIKIWMRRARRYVINFVTGSFI